MNEPKPDPLTEPLRHLEERELMEIGFVETNPHYLQGKPQSPTFIKEFQDCQGEGVVIRYMPKVNLISMGYYDITIHCPSVSRLKKILHVLGLQ